MILGCLQHSRTALNRNYKVLDSRTNLKEIVMLEEIKAKLVNLGLRIENLRGYL
jgi:hypothetical protein